MSAYLEYNMDVEEITHNMAVVELGGNMDDSDIFDRIGNIINNGGSYDVITSEIDLFITEDVEGVGDINSLNDNSETLLTYLILNDRPAEAMYFLNQINEIDVTVTTDDTDDTALHAAILSEEENLAVAVYNYDVGLQDLQLNWENTSHKTVLILAAEKGMEVLVNLLLQDQHLDLMSFIGDNHSEQFRQGALARSAAQAGGHNNIANMIQERINATTIVHHAAANQLGGGQLTGGMDMQ